MQMTSGLATLSVLSVFTACTSLGPMPGVTGLNPIPEERPGVEAQLGYVPGFFLSDAVQADPSGDVMLQFSGMFDPGSSLGAKGLSVGARYVSGHDGRGYFEPMMRYRRFLDRERRVALQAVGFGTRASGQSDGASYEALRGGLELASDIRITPENRWVELHLTGGASMTGIRAKGNYCMNEAGYGETCKDGRQGEAKADTSDVYPALFVGAYLDGFRHRTWYLHTLRLGAYMAGGKMPRVRMGQETGVDGSWYSFGLNLIMGMGGAE